MPIAAETNYAVAPGEYLREWMEDNRVTMTSMALGLRTDVAGLELLIAGLTRIGDVIAANLERATAIPAYIWQRYETIYRADLARLNKETTVPTIIDPDALTDAERVSAAFTLSMMGGLYPELKKAEAEARLKLAAAIQTWDAAEKAAVPGMHTLHEQAAVNVATQRYAEALANLLRGEDG